MCQQTNARKTGKRYQFSISPSIFHREQQPQPQNSNQKTTENLLTYEKHYIQLMSQFAKIELAELSDDIKFQIRTYMQVTNDILRLHREQIYPDLNKCDQDIGQICNVFRTALDYNSLQVYETYTGFVPRAYQVRKIDRFSHFESICFDVSPPD